MADSLPSWSGFLSGSEPGTAYVHFVGGDPTLRRAGLGAGLHEDLLQQAAERGAHTVTCVTSPGNTTSVAFHYRRRVSRPSR
jgi:ribosomal protein S18 acetylase RimI-like enzyme